MITVCLMSLVLATPSPPLSQTLGNLQPYLSLILSECYSNEVMQCVSFYN